MVSEAGPVGGGEAMANGTEGLRILRESRHTAFDLLALPPCLM
jgi:hypothetical protein